MPRKFGMALSAVVVAVVSAVGVQLAGAHARTHRLAARAAASGAPCGLRKSPGTYKHVVVIFMENNAYKNIIGNSYAPYINGLTRSCALATNYHNTTHPSLPNYIAGSTGASYAQLSPFTSDQPPGPGVEWKGNNIFHQLNLRHRRWRNYAESMPSACDKAGYGVYAPRHNPAVYDTDLNNCAANDIPLGTTSNSQLLRDFAKSTTAPAFSWITPNLCDDMHGAGASCPSNLIQTGDNWLKRWLPKITATPTYKAGQTAIFLTWDEGEPGTKYENCAVNQSEPSCHVVMIVIAPSAVRGKKVSKLFNHYSLLKSSEDLLGLPNIGSAAGATSMVAPFNL